MSGCPQHRPYDEAPLCARCEDYREIARLKISRATLLLERNQALEGWKATSALTSALAVESGKELDAKHAQLVETADKLRALRIEHAAGGNDAHWLLKDFNVLYATLRALLRAVGRGNETETAHALNYAAAQLTRLEPAFTETEEVKRIFRDKGRG